MWSQFAPTSAVCSKGSPRGYNPPAAAQRSAHPLPQPGLQSKQMVNDFKDCK